MKKALLVSVLLLNSIGLVACTNDKDKDAKQALHDCMWDETGKCQDKLAGALNDPAKRALIEQEIAANPDLARKFQAGTLTGADWNVVQAHAQMVNDKSAAMAADPNSSFYEPPGSARLPAAVAVPGAVPMADSVTDPALAQAIADTPNAMPPVMPASVSASIVGESSSTAGAAR
jgi:hypothetical protein